MKTNLIIPTHSVSQFTIRLAQKSDSEELEALRLASFMRSKPITVFDKNVMSWSHSDQKDLVLVVENGLGEIVSSLKGMKVHNKSSFDRIATATASSQVEFPCFYLATGCTAKGYEKRGFNMALKLKFIYHLIGSDVRNLVQTIHAGTTRINRLEAIGFDFSKAQVNPKNLGVYEYHAEFLLGILSQAHFSKVFAFGNSLQILQQFKHDSASGSLIKTYLNNLK